MTSGLSKNQLSLFYIENDICDYHTVFYLHTYHQIISLPKVDICLDIYFRVNIKTVYFSNFLNKENDGS